MKRLFDSRGIESRATGGIYRWHPKSLSRAAMSEDVLRYGTGRPTPSERCGPIIGSWRTILKRRLAIAEGGIGWLNEASN